MSSSFGILDQIIRSWAIVKKNMQIYYSKGPVVLMGIIFPAAMFLAFAFGRGVSAVSLMPGLIAISVFFTCSAIAPITMPWETQARTIERLISAPLAIWTILFGDMVASMLTGIIISIVPVIIALVIGTNFTNPLVLAVAIILGSMCFAALSVIISSPPKNAPQYSQMISSLIKFPLVFISGVFVPLSELPNFARGICYISPLTYFTDIARYAMGGNNFIPIAVDFIAIIGFTIVFWIVAVELHNRTLPQRI